jgi:DEP domain-containing protein 5
LESLPSLPSMSFTSYDAYLWLSNRTDNSVNSWDILKEMHIKKMICHASGEFSFPIKSGYYLYYIVQQNFESIEYKKPLGDLEAFEYEWVEVEIPPKFILSNADIQKAQENDLKESNVPSFLKDEFEKRNIDGTLYKQAHLEVDTLNKSDRVEWGHARYNREMIPGTAFEITVQWITASGPIVQELVKRWDTKAQACGFQLISIPADPLAEPFIEKSDPLRSPIFIPLNIKSLLSRKNHLFEDFSKETWDERMIFFQDEIVRRFGFIPRSCETKTGSNDICADYHYVHITGNMFVLVPRTPHAMRVALRRYGKNSSGQSSLSGSLGTQKRLKNYYHSEGSTPSKENQYISRHVQINNDYSENRQALTNSEIGFLWQWNHAIANRKWKSYNINGSDELYQHRMLRDFKDFCSNSNGRLLKFLEDSWEKKELQSLANT